jgi:hypothetical protein
MMTLLLQNLLDSGESPLPQLSLSEGAVGAAAFPKTREMSL